MPKMKTHRGAAKRFRTTGTGKLMRERAFRRKHMERKSSKVTRRLAPDVEVTGGDGDRIRRLLGI
jgi:large subunit ribosomal protein L35